MKYLVLLVTVAVIAYLQVEVQGQTTVAPTTSPTSPTTSSGSGPRRYQFTISGMQYSAKRVIRRNGAGTGTGTGTGTARKSSAKRQVKKLRKVKRARKATQARKANNKRLVKRALKRSG